MPPIRLIGFALVVCSQTALVSNARAQGGFRDIQFRSIDFETGVIEIFNFGTEAQPLDGWRLCSHDENETRRYSATSGLNGFSIEPGEALFVHFENDAGDDSNTVDIADLGGRVAGPFDRGPYSIGLYINSGFGNGANLADHVQWSLDGRDNNTADERSDEAQGFVWTDQSLWIPTTATTSRLELSDATGAALHGPADYAVIGLTIAGDYDGDGVVGVADYERWRSEFGQTEDLTADGNGDGVVNAADYTVWRESLANPPAAVTAVAVPEPTAAVILCGLLCPALRRRR